MYTKLPLRTKLSGASRNCGWGRNSIRVVKRTAQTADSKRAGRFVAKDMLEGGYVPLPIRGLLSHGYLHGECSTVRGRTAAEVLDGVQRDRGQSVVRLAEWPLSATSGFVGLKGNSIRVAGVASLQFTGSARCFDGEEARFGAVKNKKYREGRLLDAASHRVVSSVQHRAKKTCHANR